MKIQSAIIFILKIPFIKPFTHSTKVRKYSESFIIRLMTDAGVIGYGEGAPRSYVTGETLASSAQYIKNTLWPAIVNTKFSDIGTELNPIKALSEIRNTLPNIKNDGIIAWHSAIGSVELAIIDCLLKGQQKSLSNLLKPKRSTIIYSGVIGAESLKEVENVAKQCKAFGIEYIKVKIKNSDEQERVALVRKIMGPSCSIRLDANGAYNIKGAIKTLRNLEKYDIDCIEQPIRRGDHYDLHKIKKQISIPVMADESLITMSDAKNLAKYKACDYFNLRISKCGGISRTLEIAEIAKMAEIKVQIGCLAGETAILSAAGRSLASYLDNVHYAEGSFGTLLLNEDISHNSIHFGAGGKAPLLSGYGLGIEVDESILFKYSTKIIKLGKA
jgi:L-alanine-DL-glutamate epimerase-like enolase superfamily enzyme